MLKGFYVDEDVKFYFKDEKSFSKYVKNMNPYEKFSHIKTQNKAITSEHITL